MFIHSAVTPLLAGLNFNYLLASSFVHRMSDGLIEVVRLEALIKALSRELQSIGTAIAEIVSSSSSYAQKRVQLDHWLEQQTRVSVALQSAKNSLYEAMEARLAA